MADKQSREVTETVKQLGNSTEERGRKIGGSLSDLTVKVNVDVSEALTGLKAVQREAREATKALRELETYYESEGKRFYVKWKQDADDGCTDIREICMSDIPTDYLRRELAKRAVDVKTGSGYDTCVSGGGGTRASGSPISDAANAMISLGEKVASKSISDDITRSYGLADAEDGEGE